MRASLGIEAPDTAERSGRVDGGPRIDSAMRTFQARIADHFQQFE